MPPPDNHRDLRPIHWIRTPAAYVLYGLGHVTARGIAAPVARLLDTGYSGDPEAPEAPRLAYVCFIIYCRIHQVYSALMLASLRTQTDNCRGPWLAGGKE